MGENGLNLVTIIEVNDEYIVTEMEGISQIYNFPKSAAKYFNGVFLNFPLIDIQLSNYGQGRENIDLGHKSLSELSALHHKQRRKEAKE